MTERLKALYAYRHALYGMAGKQLKAKYVGSVLGVFWAVINPLLTMAAIAFIFTKVFNTGIKNFPLFALSGILPWFFFSGTLSETVGSITGQRGILHQFNLPREIIPLSVVLSNFFNYLIGWAIIYPIFIFFNPKAALLFPAFCFVLILQLAFTAGFALALSAVNVFFQDVGHLLGVLLMLWFWVTPVFYTAAMIPQQYHWICVVNPVVPFITFYQDVLVYARIPAASGFAAVAVLGAASVAVGMFVFQRLEQKFLKRV